MRLPYETRIMDDAGTCWADVYIGSSRDFEYASVEGAFAAVDAKAGAAIHVTGQTGLDALRQVQATARRDGDAPHAWAYAHGVPTVILRDSTERWEAVAEDAAILCPPRHGVEHAASVVDIAMRFANEAVRERGHAYDSPDPRYTASELVRDHIAALVDR